MRISKTSSGSQVQLSKSEWEGIGKTAGWIKESDEPEELTGEGEELGAGEDNDAPLYPEDETEWVSFSYGTTPEEIINARTQSMTPVGYPMHIKSQDDWAIIAKVVNQGIDASLEAFTRSSFDSNTGECSIDPEEMTTFLRRLYENGETSAWQLRTDILSTLNIEEI